METTVQILNSRQNAEVTVRVAATGALMMLFFAAALAAQETPAPPAQPATPAPAAAPTPMAAPRWESQGQGQGQRRGWFGISLSCDECFIQRGPGRVAYVSAPAVVSVESGSPAWQAGMRSGDTLVSVEGLSVTTPEGFERFATTLPGQSVRVGLRRGGESREVTVVPSASSSSSTTSEFYASRLRTAQRLGFRALQSQFRTPLGWLGMQTECEGCSVTGGLRRSVRFRQPPSILMVDVDGPAHRAGLRRGDTLTAIDGVDLTDEAGGRAFTAVEPGQRVTLTVRRAGAERRATLVAVARPDATPQELAAFDEYKRMRDSSDTEYRQLLSNSVQRAQTEITDLQRQLREVEASRVSVEDSRRRIATIDSVLRVLRNIERQRASGGGDYAFAYSTPTPSVYTVPGVAPNVSVVTTAPVVGRVYPLRYSRDLRSVARVEARAPGPVSVNEVGDSTIVVTANGVEVKIQLLPRR